VLIQVFDPSSTRVTGGRHVRDAFAGNVIPANRLDPVALKLMDFYPVPNRPPSTLAGASNFVGNYSSMFQRNNVTAKVDHVLSQKDHLYVRFILNRDRLLNTSVHPNPISGTRTNLLPHQSMWLISDTRTLGPRLIADMRVNLNTSNAHTTSPGLGVDASQLLGLRGVPPGAFPVFSVAGVTSLGTTPSDRSGPPRIQQQYVGSLTHVRGSHAIKFGGEVRRGTRAEIIKTAMSGSFSFTTQPTAQPGQANTGFGMASLLAGFPNSFSLRESQPLDRLSYYLAGYVQDDWKVHRDLTINLGVRWETDTPMVDHNNRMNSFDPTAVNPVSGTPGVVRFAGVDGWPREAYAADWNNLGPRWGFAWQPWGSRETVVRGGFGVFFAHPFDHAVPNVASLGFESSGALSTPDSGITAPFLLRDGVPPLQLSPQPLTPRFGAVPVGQNVNTDVQYFERSRRAGYSQQFNLGIQRQLPGGAMVSVAVIGNLSRKLAEATLDTNQIPPQRLDAIRQPGAFQQAFRPFPQFGRIAIIAPSFGVTDYYAGMVKAERRFSKGLSFLATYTWSKNLGNLDDAVTGDLGLDQPFSDYYNRKADKGPDALDIRHRLAWSAVYELPFGVARSWVKSGLLARVVGGWNIGAIATAQSGGAFTVTTQTNTTNVFSAGSQRANVLRDPNLPDSRKSLTQWFDTAAFTLPGAYNFGNAGRGIARADGRLNFDFSLSKNFPFTESAFAQFRLESFNAPNHPDFGLPGTVLGGPGFGVISSASSPRVAQLGVRIVF
jgi:hypothetical protein